MWHIPTKKKKNVSAPTGLNEWIFESCLLARQHTWTRKSLTCIQSNNVVSVNTKHCRYWQNLVGLRGQIWSGIVRNPCLGGLFLRKTNKGGGISNLRSHMCTPIYLSVPPPRVAPTCFYFFRLLHGRGGMKTSIRSSMVMYVYKCLKENLVSYYKSIVSIALVCFQLG